MKSKINRLYVFMILGIVLSVIILFTGGGYYGMGNGNNALVTLVITSVIIFFISLYILAKEFQQCKRNITLWFLILISFPLTALGGIYLVQKSISSIRKATYRNFVKKTNKEDYLKAKTEINSHIEGKIDWNKEDLGIEREWYNVEFTSLDTIFFSPNVVGEFAGLLVLQNTPNDVFLDSLQANGAYSKEEILDFRRRTSENKYLGFSFIYHRDRKYMTFYSKEMYGSPTIEDCISELRATFLYKDDHYNNINSVHYWDYQDYGKKRLYFLLF